MTGSARVGGRYAITAPIARGGMSIVFSAWDSVLDREVAVKILTGDGAPDSAERIDREIEIAARAHHPGLIEVFDAGFTTWMGGQTRFLVMEHVHGASLEQLLASNRPDARVIADIAAQVADALSYLHLRSLLHLDVKPANILVDECARLGFCRRARLTDFGIAQPVTTIGRAPGAAVVASAAYMSPEHAAGDPLTGASDVYSLGLVILRCLTGREEFPGSRTESAAARLHRDPVIPDGLPPAWASLVAAMTAREPAERPTAHDVAAEFGELRRVRTHDQARAAGRPAVSASASKVPTTFRPSAMERLRERMRHTPHRSAALAGGAV